MGDDVDEHELLEELQGMMADDDAQPAVPGVSTVPAQAELAEKAAVEQAELETKQEHEQLEHFAQQLPAAPTGPVERQGLLADSQSQF